MICGGENPHGTLCVETRLEEECRLGVFLDGREAVCDRLETGEVSVGRVECDGLVGMYG